MLRLITYLMLFIFSTSIYAQVRPRIRVAKPIKPKPLPARTDLSVGAAFTKSVLFLSRNTKDHNDATGVTINATYGGNKPFRASLEYTRYLTTDIAPTWYDIKASTVELNGQAYYQSKGKIGFYLLSGFSYNVFKGVFTGINDYQNLSAYYSANKRVVTRWFGFNTGVGFEYRIKKVIVYGSYKMRVGRSEGHGGVNIQDVCYSIGVRFNFRAPSVYRLLKGSRNRYFLNAD